jgi:hypothetical protein
VLAWETTIKMKKSQKHAVQAIGFEPKDGMCCGWRAQQRSTGEIEKLSVVLSRREKQDQ